MRFEAAAPTHVIAAAHTRAGATQVRRYRSVPDLEVAHVPPAQSLERVIAAYRRSPGVRYVEPDYRARVGAVSIDPYFGSQWALNNTGQEGGAPNADINAPEAWEHTIGAANAVIAVIDTGVDYTHDDIAGSMWTNELEIAGNGVDDDGNGYIDDIHGINAMTGSGDPMDDSGHGTAVASVIAAPGDNGIGMAGVSWRTKILACKFADVAGRGWMSDVIECLDYVLQVHQRGGGRIVATNNSFSETPYLQAVADAIAAQRDAGILFITIAGNTATNNDEATRHLVYPASYGHANVVTVAASDRRDALAAFSSFGRHSVHLAAPGVAIVGGALGDTYALYGGTSFAAPHVAGLAALLHAAENARDWRAIRNALLAGGTPTDAATGATISGRRLRAWDGDGSGSLSCSGQTVLSRLQPVASTVLAARGASVLPLSALHIRCAQPAGELSASIAGVQAPIGLHDDGLGGDEVAGDGIYAAHWPVAASPHTGTLTVSLAGESVEIRLTEQYLAAEQVAFAWRVLDGVDLQLADDEVAAITLPFAVPFGRMEPGVETLHVSSNGAVSVGGHFAWGANEPLPTRRFEAGVAAFWDDLNPAAGGHVVWGVLGEAPNREVVIEWREVAHYEHSGRVTFQLVLFESRPDVLVNYRDVSFGDATLDAGASATIGVQVAADVATGWLEGLRDETALLWSVPLRRQTATGEAEPEPTVPKHASPAHLEGGGGCAQAALPCGPAVLTLLGWLCLRRGRVL